MRTFVYGSRIIETEQQIKFERRVKTFGNWLHAIVDFFLALFLFALINLLLTHLAQQYYLFSLNTCHLLQECARVLLVDNAISTAAFIRHQVVNFVAALVVEGVMEYAFAVRAYAGASVHDEKEHDDNSKHTEALLPVSICSVFSYKNKVCFLS